MPTPRRSLTLSFDHPDGQIGPNSWGRLRDRIRIKTQVRESAGWLLKDAMQGQPDAYPWTGKVWVDIRWVQHLGKLPDDDNVVGRCKPLRDSTQDAGLVVDDKQIRLRTLTIERGSSAYVELTFEEAGE